MEPNLDWQLGWWNPISGFMWSQLSIVMIPLYSATKFQLQNQLGLPAPFRLLVMTVQAGTLVDAWLRPGQASNHRTGTRNCQGGPAGDGRRRGSPAPLVDALTLALALAAGPSWLLLLEGESSNPCLSHPAMKPINLNLPKVFYFFQNIILYFYDMVSLHSKAGYKAASPTKLIGTIKARLF